MIGYYLVMVLVICVRIVVVEGKWEEVECDVYKVFVCVVESGVYLDFFDVFECFVGLVSDVGIYYVVV